MTAKIKSLVRHTNNHYKNKPRGISDRAFEKVYWPYLPIVLIAGALLTFGGQSGTLQAAMRSSHGRVLDYATSMTLSRLLSDTNSARVSHSVGKLSLNSKLDAAAQAQANDMAARNYWSHSSPEGNPPWVWVNAQHYSYQKLGQNLAAGFDSEQAVINGWLASAPHRENLLDPDYTEVGFGSANNPNYTAAGSGPMTIIVAFYADPAPGTKPLPVTATTTYPTSHGVGLAYRTSRAQVAFGQLSQSSFATSFAILAVFAAIGLFLSRHILALRRAWVYSESFVIRHPLVDVGLLSIAAMSFLLAQTAGFIQ